VEVKILRCAQNDSDCNGYEFSRKLNDTRGGVFLMDETNIYRRKSIKVKMSIILLMTIVMAYMFYTDRDAKFENYSESFVVSMICAARYNIDVSNHKYGLMRIRAENREIWSYSESYNIYADGTLFDGRVREYYSQLGFQGWIFYILAKSNIPSPVFLFRLGCCLLLSLLISLICIELNKIYGILLSAVFFITSMISPILGDFSTNLYWVAFTWFIPMYLGLVCLNNLNRRFWLYPLFYLAIFIKSACGYEYITVIMLSSIMFLVIEFIVCIKKDRQRSKLIFKSIVGISVMSLLGFISTFIIHSYFRGDGNILVGSDIIYREDVLRRTFGNALEFPEVYADSLNASILKVLMRYFFDTQAGKVALFVLAISCIIFIYKIFKNRKLLSTDLLLFVASFITCISWFILGKSHSYIHHQINTVLWYMSFVQIGFYILVKHIIRISYYCYEKKDKLLQYANTYFHKLKEEIKCD
jgi:hypothetical protein